MFLLGLVCDDHTRFVLKTILTDDELLWGIVMRLVENELRLWKYLNDLKFDLLRWNQAFSCSLELSANK